MIVTGKELVCFLDIETTGLDPEEDLMLEIATVVTDLNFHELWSYESVIEQSRSTAIFFMGDYVLKMHTENGLLDEIENGRDMKQVEREILSFFEQAKAKKVFLAGNSVHFDRSFLHYYMPRLEELFYHGHYDVSAAARVTGLKYAHEAKGHRAMPDARCSLENARHFRKLAATLA